MGAPAREAVAKEAIAAIVTDLKAALASNPNDAVATARAVGVVLSRALRLLLAQMQVLKADSANGRLTVLAASLPAGKAVAHAMGMFAQRFELSPENLEEAELHGKLPVTAEFAASSPSAEHIEPLLAALESAYGADPASTIPKDLRAGRGRAAGAAQPPPGSLLAEPLQLAKAPVDTWRARFRCALAALLLQPVDFSGNPAAPEVLRAYGSQLDAAKVRLPSAALHSLTAR